uniref:major histocompatibility complex class I UIA precursor n=1 Tax=Danio rerio TaxID=7955 RepID=UPI00004F9AF0|nr:major histocompatibility complex class I UIA precursor [Danio rerio]AAH93149.1 Zgc:111997 [Danio rerio]AAI65457.1 Zgc:111997 protein [Danio rerio]
MQTIILLLLGAHLANAVTHSMKYIITGVSELDSFPEYTSVGTVDDIPFVYFDSNIKRMIPKTEWIKNEGADYWDRESQRESGIVPVFKNNIQIAMQRFNQTAGVRTVQNMYGCEWDDQTGAKNGFDQYGYDGEDWLTLELKELRWISPVQQAMITTQNWNKNRAQLEYYRNYYSTECIEWLQKYLQYGKSSLQKTASPQVSLLQKSSSSPVVCHATGFYPSAIKISWQKNGQDHDEDVDLGELLPNADGTFQRTSTLNVKPEEWKNNKFSCVVEHQGETRAADDKILINNDSAPTGLIAGVVAALVLLVVIAVAGYMVYQKKKGFKPVSGSDDGSNSSAHAVPQA